MSKFMDDYRFEPVMKTLAIAGLQPVVADNTRAARQIAQPKDASVKKTRRVVDMG
jgi:hypothetical protein